MSNRRNFLKAFGLAGLGVGFVGLPKKAVARNKFDKLTILHTNDLHSRVEPFPENDKRNGGRGGLQRINALVKRIRNEEENVLLFDCGDVFQGTPYFNFFKGEVEYKLMSKIGYDAGTIGNHEFDNGIDGFSSQLPYANFPIVNSNYDVTGTSLEGKVDEYKIFNKGNIKIGVFGLGVELEGLVSAKNYGTIVYNEPIEVAKKMVAKLKLMSCDIIICLSHLGYDNAGAVCDLKLAKETSGIDLILGGHSHTFLETATRVSNAIGEEVLVNQVGWAGVSLGRIDMYIDSNDNLSLAKSSVLKIDSNIT